MGRWRKNLLPVDGGPEGGLLGERAEGVARPMAVMCKAGPVNSGGHSTVLTAVAKMNTLTLGGNLLVERN